MYKFRKFWNLTAFILAFQIAFAFSFFIGIFLNYHYRNKTTVPTFTENRWFYITRGYPIAWAGVTRTDLSVDFPVIKAPFLKAKTLSFSNNVKVTKIIDLRIFIPLLLVALGVVYPLTFLFSKTAAIVEENRSFNVLLVPIFIILALADIFFYFFWFPRI